MSPQDQAILKKYTNAAKKIVFNAERMKTFQKMLGSKVGALHAVHAVISVIEKASPIPPQIVHQLGVNIYLMMVHFLSDAHGIQPSKEIVSQVVNAIQHSTQLSHGQTDPAAASIAPAQGILASQMGAQA